jgi:hypothetical protein
LLSCIMFYDRLVAYIIIYYSSWSWKASLIPC